MSRAHTSDEYRVHHLMREAEGIAPGHTITNRETEDVKNTPNRAPLPRNLLASIPRYSWCQVTKLRRAPDILNCIIPSRQLLESTS